MTPRWASDDWNALGFWLAVAALILFWDFGPPRWAGHGTISVVYLGWCDRWPWLRWATPLAALAVAWHLTLDWWPFRGE